MPGETLKQQHESAHQEDTFSLWSRDYFLLYLVLGLLGVFYYVIMSIMNNDRNDRADRLNRLK